MWKENREWTFSLEEAFLWIMDLLSVWTLFLTAPAAENSLVSTWCNAISQNLLQWRNKFIFILDGLRVSTFSAISFYFWVNYSFKCALIVLISEQPRMPQNVHGVVEETNIFIEMHVTSYWGKWGYGFKWTRIVIGISKYHSQDTPH